MMDAETGETVLGSIVCSWLYAYWLESENSVVLRYPIALIAMGENAVLFWVYAK